MPNYVVVHRPRRYAVTRSAGGGRAVARFGAVGPPGAAGDTGPAGPNLISDATAAGTLTPAGDAVTLLVLNAAGTLVRRLTATTAHIGKQLGVVDLGGGVPGLGWVDGYTPPPYSPSLDFSDVRNSMYSGSVV